MVYLDTWDAWFKLEYVSPSGSFKDRGAAITISHALELGVTTVIEDSSGNAGIAIAQYAARGDLNAEIYVPASVSEGKRRVIAGFGARVVEVPGDREAVANACIDRVASGVGWYASHVWRPSFFLGTMTFAIELCAQRDWEVPDAVVLPIGNGTLVVGAYRGFQALIEAGWIDQMPRLLGVQAVGFDPLAVMFDGATDGCNQIADGIQVRHPPRKSQIRDAISASDGYVLAVTESAVRSSLDRLHHAGLFVEPTGAVGPAGLDQYRDRGLVADDSDVVVPLTGSGLKAGR